jgi:NAD(P)H-hydrate repair Nnr-like enzyme with NAD(P)H-hydrate epimerase domain
MSFARLGSVLAAALVLAASAFGCGGTALDDKKTEDQIKDSVEKAKGGQVTSVDCPSGVDIEPGKVFSCTVTLQGGKTETAKLKIRDEDANLDFFDLEPSK